MTPAPTTISFFGGAGRLNAPVEDTIVFSSISHARQSRDI